LPSANLMVICQPRVSSWSQSVSVSLFT
jgi:hypothetical protein